MVININAYARLARFDKPAGAWLLLLPCWWGLALAGSYQLKYYLLFAVGALVMRGAGCVINDMADRKFDALVERTKNRPLASGEISMFGAVVFLLVLLLIGLGVLLQLPRIAVVIGLASVPLFVIYPFTKRFTYWPQIFLGLTFNIGILVAYATVKNSLCLPSALLYAGAVFWTLGYDTIYAHQDKADDVRIGVKSTALRLAGKTRFYVAAFYLIFFILVITATYFQRGLTLITAILFCAAFIHFSWQVVTLKIDDQENCMRLFKSNICSGLIIFAAIIVTSLRT